MSIDKKRKIGSVGPSRRAWVKASVIEGVMYINPELGPDDELSRAEPGQDVTLFINKVSSSGGSSMSLPLSIMTEEELVALRHVIQMAFANALEVVKMRDARALKMLAEGETALSRIYRETPRLFVREGEDYEIEPKFLLREWEGQDGRVYEVNASELAKEKIASSRNPDEETDLDNL